MVTPKSAPAKKLKVNNEEITTIEKYIAEKRVEVRILNQGIKMWEKDLKRLKGEVLD